VEDISKILTAFWIVKEKPKVLEVYFEKLARIFWVSENHLYHAYACSRYLDVAMRDESISEDAKRQMASAVALAALAIPFQASAATGSADVGLSSAGDAEAEENPLEREKRLKLSALFKIAGSAAPTRETLLAELQSKGILRRARPEIAVLFRALETEFQPLALVQKVMPILAKLREPAAAPAAAAPAFIPPLAQYVPLLERLVVVRLVEQLSAVYSSVRMSHVHALLASGSVPLAVSGHEVERLLVRMVRSGRLSARIDHKGGALRFVLPGHGVTAPHPLKAAAEGAATAAESTPTSLESAPLLRRQLMDLAVRLQAVPAVTLPATSATTASSAAGVAGVSKAKSASALYGVAFALLDTERRETQRRILEIEARKMRKEKAAYDQQLMVSHPFSPSSFLPISTFVYSHHPCMRTFRDAHARLLQRPALNRPAHAGWHHAGDAS
jgi:translation initiation factor 3 subunit A